jgi:acetyl esterase/lipase
VVSHLARDEKLSPPLTGVSLIIPVVLSTKNLDSEYQAEIRSYEELKDAPVLPSKTIEMFEGHYQPDPKSHLWNLFAPPTKFDNLPPTYFQVCGTDPLRDEGLLYERLLREEHGCKTKLDVYPGLPHGFHSYFPQLKSSQQFVKDAAGGIGWLLGRA